MGVLTDLVIARPDEAPLVAESGPDSPRWPREDLKGFDPITLGTLWSLLAGRPFEELEPFAFLHEAGHDGPWVNQVPADLVERLAALPPSAIPSVAAAWGQTEELEGHDVDVLADVLRALVAFASRARGEDQTLLMWTCL